MPQSPDTGAPITQVDLSTMTVSRVLPQPESQAGELVKSLIEASSQRATVNARITSRINAERPYQQDELVRANLGWRSNITTRPLATLMQRAYGRFPRAVADAKTLTTARLPRGHPAGNQKTEFFRTKVTTFIRSNPKWKTLVNSIAWESTAFGYTAAVWRDEESYLPMALRQDSFFAPVGCGQHASSVPVHVFRDDMLPHEAVDLLQTVERAKAGAESLQRSTIYTWFPERLAEAISDAVREDHASTTNTTEDIRKLQDLRRQMASASVLGTGRKVVPLYHVYAVELTGRVSHFIVDKKYRLLFEWLDRFESMDRCTTLFAFEHGDGTLHGSKGIGRLAYNVAALIDRSTNDVMDRLLMSGKLFVKSPAAKHRSFNATMRGGFCLVDPDFELLPSVKLDAGVTDSVSLDGFLEAKLDQMVGTVTPKALEGERVTAAAVNLLASRESDRSDDYLGRFLPQIADMVTETIRRLCLVPTQNASVLAFRQELQAGGLSPEEIALLASQPAMTTIYGWTGVDRQNVILACVEGRGNPVYDQRAIEEAKLEAQVGPEFASSVLSPAPDPVQAAEQSRQQTLESLALMQGLPVPVSPRDNHAIHLAGLLPFVQQTVQAAAQNPAADQILVGLVAHARAHLDLAGTDPSVAEFVPIVEQLEAAMTQLNQAMQPPTDPAAPAPPGPPPI